MNSWKVILEQTKAMKFTWSTARGGSAGHIRFQGAKKRPAEGKDLNAILYNAVIEVIKSNRHLNYKAPSNSGSEDKQEHFNFETLKIGEEWGTVWTPHINDVDVPETGTEAE